MFRQIVFTLSTRGYLTAIYVVVMGMIASGLIRPLIVFHLLEEQGLLYVALLTTGFMISRGVSSLYTGLMLKSYGYRFTGSIALTLWCFSVTLYARVPPQLYPFIRVLEGFSAGLLWPLMQSLVSISVPREYRSRAMSLYFIAGSIAYNAGIWVGGYIEEVYGSSLLFLIALIILFATIILYTIISPIAGGKQPIVKVKKTYARVFSELASIAPLVIVVGGLTGLSLDYVMAYAKDVSGYPSLVARILWSYTGYVALIISYTVSHILDKYPSKTIPYAVGYTTVLSLASLSLKLPPELVYGLTILPRISSSVFKPVIRGFITKTSSDPEIATTAVNFLSNISAAFTPLIVVSLDTVVGGTPTFNSIGMFIYASISLIILLLLCLRKVG